MVIGYPHCEVIPVDQLADDGLPQLHSADDSAVTRPRYVLIKAVMKNIGTVDTSQ